jgi:spore germination cell wall hydrolase CwlJ-like protein
MDLSGDSLPPAGERTIEKFGDDKREAGGTACMPAPAVGRVAAAMLAAAVLAGCTATQGIDDMTTASIAPPKDSFTEKDRECMERAIFFESNRSSEEGLVAVGTVVMNRVESEQFPDTVCGVVGQRNQFAPGVLSRNLPREKVPDIQVAAEKVLEGYRHPKLDEAMYFHMAGLKFPYKNMHYQLEAGGNAFYERR